MPTLPRNRSLMQASRACSPRRAQHWQQAPRQHFELPDRLQGIRIRSLLSVFTHHACQPLPRRQGRDRLRCYLLFGLSSGCCIVSQAFDT